VIAPREGDAIRVDYQRGSGHTFVATGAHDTRESSFSLRYPKSGRCNAYSPTQELQSRSGGSECTVEVGGEGAAVTILIPDAEERSRRHLDAGERARLRRWLCAHHAHAALGRRRHGAARHHLRARRVGLDERVARWSRHAPPDASSWVRSRATTVSG